MFFGRRPETEKTDNPESGKEVKPRNQILQTPPEANNKKLENPKKADAPDKSKEAKQPEKRDEPEKSGGDSFRDSLRVNPEDLNKNKLEKKPKPDTGNEDEEKGPRIREYER